MEKKEYRELIATMYVKNCSHKEMTEKTLEAYPELNQQQAN